MINLLPPDDQRSMVYARRNTMLLKACLALIGVTAGAIIMLGAGHLYLAQATTDYRREAAAAKASLQDQNIDGTKAQIQELSSSVNLVLKVLSQEILFSKLLRQAGAVMPTGSSLSTIEISDDQKGIDITAGVDNYQVGTQVQINLSDPNNKIFEKVDLVSVKCDGQAGISYPCSAKLRGLFGDNSPYLFINKAGN